MMTAISKHVKKYVKQVENGDIRSCNEQKLLVKHVRKCFDSEDIYTDENQLEKYLRYKSYFPYDELFSWEAFLLALWDCTYWRITGLPRWPDLFCLIGRGAGKDGFIAYDAFCDMTRWNGIKNYHIDICANNEEQALTPMKDIIAVLEDPANRKLKEFFYWTKEIVSSKQTNSETRGRTNSPKGKDGLRSGKVIFNEIHQYENYDNINVFTTGLGKKKHPRRGYFTTMGDVRDGPLDHLVDTSMRILNGEESDNGLLPFICKLNDKDEVHDPDNWEMANPSLPYRPNLKSEIEKEYREWKADPAKLPAFMTKRMNIPDGNPELQVTAWENIERTKAPVPDLTGWTCTVGIDYSKITDFASVNLHFRDGETRYDINHSWLCTQSTDLPRIRVPWKEWAQKGYLTVIDDVEIPPNAIAEYIADAALKYDIEIIAIDNFRYALLANALSGIGFDSERKNIKMVRPSDIMTVVPVIDSCFANKRFIWGENPPLRWAVNNTKLIRSSRREGSDTGNFYYGKIEAKSRKTDPFMALVHAMTVENELDLGTVSDQDFAVWRF
jgi:phage terminase large subunit-like protein